MIAGSQNRVKQLGYREFRDLVQVQVRVLSPRGALLDLDLALGLHHWYRSRIVPFAVSFTANPRPSTSARIASDAAKSRFWRARIRSRSRETPQTTCSSSFSLSPESATGSGLTLSAETTNLIARGSRSRIPIIS